MHGGTVLIQFVIGAVIFCVAGCVDPFGTSEDSATTKTFAAAFPFESSSNCWYYSDDNGNQVVITVVDTISDDSEKFYKVSFAEAKLDTIQSEWFVKRGNEVRYSSSLRAQNYDLFLPGSFEGDGGSFDCGSRTVSYMLDDSMVVGTHYYGTGVELQYATPLLHGFGKIRFADGVGIVSLTDSRGRWPIEYVLDSARIGKAVRRF